MRAVGHDVVPGNAPTGFETCTTTTGCKAGTFGGGAGQLFNPLGFDLSPGGELHVADGFSARISVFGPGGVFLRAFGYDVRPGSPFTLVESCTAATGCQVAPQGDDAGMLNGPSALAFDDAGNLFVAESVNDRVSVFGPGGAFLRAFGYDVVPGNPETGLETCTIATECKAGAQGGGPGQLDSPRGVAVDASGNLHVAESFNHRISVFTSAGGFVRAFGHDVVPGNLGTGLETCTNGTDCKSGTSGGGAGQLNNPQGLAFDEAGELVVVDGFNSRVSKFGAAGSFARAFGQDVVPGAPAGFEVCTSATGCKPGLSGPAPGQLAVPGGVAVDCRGGLWVADVGNGRVQRFGEPGTPLPPCSAGSPAGSQRSCAGRPATITGTAGSDRLNGTGKRDVFAALEGNDVVKGLKGNDLMCGGPGRDRLIGAAGKDDLRGQAGHDILKGGPGPDALRGGKGRDKLIGGSAKDKLRGGPGRDRELQ